MTAVLADPPDENGDDDRDEHAESGASEFSRRSGGALIAELLPEQYAELNSELESEHAQDPGELGVVFLTRATQDEPRLPQDEHAGEPAVIPESSEEESTMSVAKVTEITAESDESFDAAIRDG